MAGYDTVVMTLRHEQCGGVSFLEEVPTRLSNVDLKPYRAEGYLDGLKVKVTDGGVTVDGSLCKYYLGDNLQEMTRTATRECVERISDELELPMKSAAIWRFDMGANLPTVNPAHTYFPLLGDLRWYDRVERPSTLTYENRIRVGGELVPRRAFCIYDKGLECKVRGEEIGELYANRNITRVETRYLRVGSSKYFFHRGGFDKVTAATLYEENFYIWANDDFRETYEKITKNRINVPMLKEGEILGYISKTKTMKELNALGYSLILERVGGAAKFERALDIARKRGDITAAQKHDLKKAVDRGKEYAARFSRSAGPTVEELDALIERNVKFYR